MRKPMIADPYLTSYYRHAKKHVYESRLLDDMSDTSHFELRAKHNGGGYTAKAGESPVCAAISEATAGGAAGGSTAGEAASAVERFARIDKARRDGKDVMRMSSAVIVGPPNPEKGRNWGSAILYLPFNGEDWSDYNRVTYEVYPDLPGFRIVSMYAYLYNDGESKLPKNEVREGAHSTILKNHEWNFCTWEFPELGREKVIGFGFEYRLQGAEPGASTTAIFDFANFRLEKVHADYTKGWTPECGEISFSHTGYLPSTKKTAIANGLPVDEFSLISSDDGRVVYTGTITLMKAHTGAYQILDFSSFTEEGRYFIKAGDKATPPFSISATLWHDVVEKVINSFYALRCGYPIHGIHDVCHQDLRAQHDGLQKVMNGGWHDAGDLSQGIVNTAESCYAMMSLATSLKGKEASLADLLWEEVRWGQDWVLKTRFTNGHRVAWLTLGYWMDGIFGSADDLVYDAIRSPYENFICAASEALAARFFAEGDAPFARYNLNAAKEDFDFAAADILQDGNKKLDVHAQGVLAAVELFGATNDSSYLNKAVEYAKAVLACQQDAWPDWQKPMRGFFYTDTDKTEILHYPHRGHEQAPMVALCKLYGLIPGHREAVSWLNGIQLYADYIKGIVKYTAPYDMLPASIYSLGEIEDTGGRRSSFRIPPENAINQIKQGIKLSDTHYLKLFPVWYTFRGNSGTALSAARGVLECALVLNDNELIEICRRQLEWHVGRNPFNQSLIWGEGYNYTTQYTATSGDIVGTLPVGVETQHDEDVPYWPVANCPNYKEVWVHPASRWLWLMEHLYD
ncbi:MAG: glycoside hydrolase family 9 protein [Oscillospiraceae bacterium]|nr:glycoside hydrolase family 9 protein [Oscillospiraceae bacterium]